MRNLVKMFSVTCAAILLWSVLGIAKADLIPLRQGTVVSTTETERFSYISAKDEQGKEFWILTTLCILAEGAKIEVLAGAHYDSVQALGLDKMIEDVYTAQLIRVNGKEIKGFGTHGLPDGCITVKR